MASQLQKAFAFGIENAGIDSEYHYLVGVSGGMDSVFLAHFLKENGIVFSIAHLNHNSRQSSTRDQEFVRGLAEQMGVGFFTDTVNVPEIAKNEKLSFEEAARMARYRFLFDTAEEHQYIGVIVGHHADDQVETVLMHLLRGSGIAGLAGMKYREMNLEFSQNISLLRPMLGIWREEIENYCREEHLLFVEDESNADVAIYRNRLRHELLPLLGEYNSRVREHLWQTSMISQQAEATLEAYVDQAWADVIMSEQAGLIVCNIEHFNALEQGLQRLMLRRILSRLLPTMRDFGYDLTITTQELIANPPEGGQWKVIGDVYAYLHKNQLCFGQKEAIFASVNAQYPQWKGAPVEMSFKQNERYDLSNGFYFWGEVLETKVVTAQPWMTSDAYNAWIDADAIQYPVLLRAYRKGDRFSPFGMSGQHTKLSDYFIDQKLPQPVREFFPFVCDRSGILWVIGERIDERCRITAKTRRILHIQLCRKQKS